MEDIKNEEPGSVFHDWADAIMDDYVLAQNRSSRVMIIPDNFRDLRDLSQLDIFDAVTIFCKIEAHKVHIRKMEWTIVNNAILLELYFTRDGDGVAWTPIYELSDLFTDIMFDTF